MNHSAHSPLSAAALWRTTLITLLLAAVVVVCLVLPAEFGRDPSGIGARLGLLDLAAEPAGSEQAPVSTNDQQRHFSITLGPGMGQEFKVVMPANALMEFEWHTDGAAVYFDQHGDPLGDTSGYFMSYSESSASSMKGRLLTVFAGNHGWYWENRTGNAVTINLSIGGDFPLMEHKH